MNMHRDSKNYNFQKKKKKKKKPSEMKAFWLFAEREDAFRVGII